MQSVNQPFFSVIIPVYNRANCIKTAVGSVLRQTFNDFELIIVDDGSTDDTHVRIEGLRDQRIRSIRQNNLGVSAARNKGIFSARGEWVVFLDSDDEARANWLAEIAACIVAHDNLGAVFCGHELRHVGKIPERSEIMLPRPMGPIFNSKEMSVLAGTFAARRDVLSAIGGYADCLKYSENTEMLLRLVTYCQEHSLGTGRIDLPLTIYNRPAFKIRADHHTFYENILNAAQYILDRHEVLFLRDPQALYNYQSVAGVNAARLGRLGEARQYFCKNIRIKPFAPRNYLRILLTLSRLASGLVWK